jgi:hypothetical protein
MHAISINNLMVLLHDLTLFFVVLNIATAVCFGHTDQNCVNSCLIRNFSLFSGYHQIDQMSHYKWQAV